jgi:hypothetical protein
MLGVPSAVTMHDAYIDDLLEVADEQVIAYTGMAAVTQTTVTEKYNIGNTYTTQFTLRNFPVSAVANVRSGGATLSTDTYYFESRSGLLALSDSTKFFAQGRQKVQVTYTYGYSSVPADLSHAASLICAHHFNTARHAGMRSESGGGYSYRLSEDYIPMSAQGILAKYKRIFPKESN